MEYLKYQKNGNVMLILQIGMTLIITRLMRDCTLIKIFCIKEIRFIAHITVYLFHKESICNLGNLVEVVKKKLSIEIKLLICLMIILQCQNI